MNKRSVLIAIAVLSGALVLPGASCAQGYPGQPVRIVVPFPPGGGADILARVIAQRLTESLRTQVLVDNRAGAGGMIGSEQVARAAPDGYTLVFTTSSSHSINPHIGAKPRYDPLRDFT
ncbi:MAG: tripartite tricarboxylate transporter substrate binding protein, partial [Betaproteobacteria bacterium]|nr:tripartite tricarboxylate transporter substrate binding protein [Betaproteobacteria bacterium]